MFKKSILGLLIILGSLIALPTQAALDLELTQGIDAALPIAIIPFAGDQPDASGHATVTQIIKNDLQNSGQFRVKSTQQGVEDVLKGTVTSIGFSRYRVAFQLMSVFDKSKQNATNQSTNSMLLNFSFDTSKSGLRALAHHISDLVYKSLTGTRGIFSTKIAYILVQNPSLPRSRKYLLDISDADGFNPQTLLESAQPIMSPAWAPDGKSLAYVSFEGHRASIYLQDLSTGKRHIISNYPGINGAPAFSPDGKKLALVLTRTGNPKIYLYDLQLKKLTQITHGYSIDTEPAWAPDGKSLVFTSNRGGTPQIYRYDFDGKQIMRVTFEGNYNARAAFLPSDRALIMMHRGTGMFGIAREDLTTGQIHVLVQTGADESPSISPNGKMIIYATKYGGRGVLAMVSTDGRVKLRLPAREGTVREPAWSPFTTS